MDEDFELFWPSNLFREIEGILEEARKKEKLIYEVRYSIPDKLFDALYPIFQDRIKFYEELDRKFWYETGQSPESGDSTFTHFAKKALKSIKKKCGQDLTGFEVHVIITILAEKILGKIIE